jgi:predicted MFS family arabinose efflux permease
VLHWLGPRRTLPVGLLGYLAGAAVSATATSPWTYAGGRLLGGLGSGLLAVYGISAVIRELDEAMRARVVAASSAMWILPAFVGPPGTLALEHAVGWRWALLAPVPIALAGRLLLARATTAAPARPVDPAGRETAAEGDPVGRETTDPGTGRAAGEEQPRPVGRTLLIPAGAALMLTHRPVLVALGTVVALVGVARLLPAGTTRGARGLPAALAAMVLFATGWFGAGGLITVLLTDGYGTSVARAAVVLSAAPLAWGVTSLVVGRRVPPAAGLALAAAGVTVVATTHVYPLGLVAWTLAGVGIGLAYPGLYVRCTTSDRPAEAAAAVLTAEEFGSLLGAAGGGALTTLAGLTPAYAVFAALLAAAALLATRTRSLVSA